MLCWESPHAGCSVDALFVGQSIDYCCRKILLLKDASVIPGDYPGGLASYQKYRLVHMVSGVHTLRKITLSRCAVFLCRCMCCMLERKYFPYSHFLFFIFCDLSLKPKKKSSQLITQLNVCLQGFTMSTKQYMAPLMWLKSLILSIAYNQKVYNIYQEKNKTTIKRRCIS